MKTLTLILSMLLSFTFCKGQKNDSLLIMYGSSFHTMGFIFAHGISWTKNEKQDSVLEIIIQGDTMTAIRNLLLYCMQEKEENDNAGYVLRTLNLDHLSSLIKNEDFDFYLKQYRNSIERNNLKRGIKPKK